MNPTEGKLTEAEIEDFKKNGLPTGYAKKLKTYETNALCNMALESLKAPAVTEELAELRLHWQSVGHMCRDGHREIHYGGDDHNCPICKAPAVTEGCDCTPMQALNGHIACKVFGKSNKPAVTPTAYRQVDSFASGGAPAVTTGERPVDLVGWDEAQLEALRRPVSEEKLKSMLEVCRLAIKDTSQGHHNTISTTKWVLAQTIYMALSAPAPLSSEAVGKAIEALEEAGKGLQMTYGFASGLKQLEVANALRQALLTPSPSEKPQPTSRETE